MSDKIKVVVKVRPLIPREIEDKLTNYWHVKDNSIYLLGPTGKDYIQNFTFDKVYNVDTTTVDIYNDIAKPIVEAAVRGINGTIFAYGQTSSGKTYTMSGTEDSPGIVQLAVHELFTLIKNVPNRDFLLRVSYIEIYNENINDLLDEERTNIKIHETLQGVKVDVSEKFISTPDEVFDIMQQGEANRRVGATDMNEKSSRSHSIFQIIIESREHSENPDEEGCAHVSQLNLVDLAGSERAGQTGATGLRFKEGTHINKSLSALGLVIKQLANQQKHVSYRDSKLTRILQNSLGGNTNTSIVCAVTPASIDETVSTLQFASRAKLIENKPVVNEVHTNATKIQALMKQLADLQLELESKKLLEQDNKLLCMKIKKLKCQILNGSFLEPRRMAAVPRRATICTTQLQTIHEQPDRSTLTVPKTGFRPIVEKKVTINDEIIEIDSDDEDVQMDNTPCSPRHKCYAQSKTPPCVLREKAKRAEQNYSEIVEMSKLEKIYSPSIVELKHTIQIKDRVITELEDKVDNLNTMHKEQETKLNSEINKRDADIKNIQQTRDELKKRCDLYDAKLAEWEFSYETLKNKSKSREDELLSRLEEKDNYYKSQAKPLFNFLEISKDITLVTSDNETSLIDEDEVKKDDFVDIQKQINDKENIIKELEKEIEAQKLNLTTLQVDNTNVNNLRKNLEEKVEGYAEENKLLRTTIDTLNSTIQSQKNTLDTLTNDIMSCSEAVKEIRQLNNDDMITDNIIDIEYNLTSNNENIKVFIADFKTFVAGKNKEINILKEQNEANSKIKVILDEKEKELSKVAFELLQIKDKIQNNQDQIANLLQENETLMNNNNTINRQLADFEDKNKCLQTKLKETVTQKDNEIKQLKDTNENMMMKLTEKEVRSQEILTGNEDLHDQITKLNSVIKNLEKDNNNQQSLILTLTERKHSEEYTPQVKLLINKTKEILCNFTHSVNIEEDISNNFDEAIVVLNKYLTDAATAVTKLMSEKRDIEENINNLKNELVILTDKNLILQQKIKDNDLLKQNYNHLSDELQQLSCNFELITKQNEQLQTQINQFKTEIVDKDKQLIDKQNEILSLNERNLAINTEKEKAENHLLIKEKEYEQKLEKYENIVEEMNKINKLEHNIVEITAELNRCKSEIDTKNCVLNSIASNVVNLSNALNTENDTIISIEDFIHNYEKIPTCIDNLLVQIENIKLHVISENKKLHISQEETKQLTLDKLKLDEDILELNNELDSANKTIQTLKDDNKNSNDNLLNIKNILESLKIELDSKNSEVNNIALLNEKFKHDLENMRLENVDLKVQLEEIKSKTHMHGEKSSTDTNKLNPSPLSKICLKKIVKSLYTEEYQPEKQLCDCSCKVMVERENENVSLKLKVDELTSLNQNLQKDAEDAKQEIVLLIDLSSELYKKILNHRASLSTFAATTYAENKLLKIQMKALLHHHTRMLKACQRDLSDMKCKLGTLLRILESDPNHSMCSLNNSWKRFSWPNALPLNTSLYTLKNESNMTLDSDLLMIDTNVTLTTANNSTLVQDETCYSAMEGDDKKTDCMGIMMTENIYEELHRLVEENQSLRQHMEQLTDENNHLQVIIDKTISPCTVELSKNDAKELESLNFKLKELTIEKKNIEIKYNDLMTRFTSLDSVASKVKELENNILRLQDEVTEKNALQEKCKALEQDVKTCDNLQRKVQNLERDCDNKSKHIIKLQETLNKNIVELKQLQDENNSLSTELIDNISETDTLKKEIEDLKTNIISQQANTCLQCHIKDKIELFQEENKKMLLNEVCASREDCKPVTKVVETITNQLEGNNMSERSNQTMKLDQSITDGIAENININSAISERSNVEQKSLVQYSNDKIECFKFYTQIVDTDKVFNEEMKIIDIMRMLYDSVVNVHGTKVQNLQNKIINLEESHEILQSKLDTITSKHDNLCVELEIKEQIVAEFSKVVKKLKNNIDDMGDSFDLAPNHQNNIIMVNMFKENILQAFDKDFSLPVSSIFETILKNLEITHQNDFGKNSDQYELLQNKMKNVLLEFNDVNDLLLHTKTQLREMEEQYNKLQAQNKRTDEITTAVTLDLIRREELTKSLIKAGLEKLKESEIELAPSAQESLVILFEYINESKKRQEDLEKEVSSIKAELEQKSVKVSSYDQEIIALRKSIEEKKLELIDQNKRVNNEIALALSTENNRLKEEITKNNKYMSEKDAEIVKIMERIAAEEEENKKLNALYNVTIEERDLYNSELKDAGVKLHNLQDKNKHLTQNIEMLQVALEEKNTYINELAANTKKMFDDCEILRNENQKLVTKLSDSENEILNKNKEIQNMQINVKTIEKSAEILSNSIKRITKEKEDVELERDTKIKELQTQLTQLQQSYETLSFELKDAKSRSDNITRTSIEKRDSLKRDSLESNANSDAFVSDRRERRRSLFDNNRTLAITPDDMDAVFAKRSETGDMFPENNSNRSTPTNRRLSGLSRNEQDADADKKRTSLTDSISATRLRRQSIHDLHRVSLHLQDDDKLRSKSSRTSTDSQSELESCRRELEELRVKYQELDDECETCAKYLEERNEECYGLSRNKKKLEKQVAELSEQLEKYIQRNDIVIKSHVAVNTDEDWSNLHAVVVDRMSYDAEIEKNKRLTRALEEFHVKNRDLKTLVAKYDKKLNNDANIIEISRLRNELSVCSNQCESLQLRVQELDQECEECARVLQQTDQQCANLQTRVRELSAELDKCTCGRDGPIDNKQDQHDILEELQQRNKELQHKLTKLQMRIKRDTVGRDLDAANEQLSKCKTKNMELMNRCHVLSEKCDQKQMLLSEKEDYCKILTEQKLRLEEKLIELQDITDKSMSFKRKRRSLHDQQREMATNTDACESAMALEIQNLQKQIETLKRTSKTVYVDTGSAIVQNQQISDIMRENQKLMKTNEKLVRLCKKRGKLLSDENRENLRPDYD